MNKFLQGVIAFSFIIALSFILIGCDNKVSVELDADENESGTFYELTSSPDRLVFYKADVYEVYYFYDNKLAKIDQAMVFETEEDAKKFYTQEGGEKNRGIKCIGKVFIQIQDSNKYKNIKNYSQEELKEYMLDNNYIIK